MDKADLPISATRLAEKYNISRQVVVGDIAILRAEGNAITATPRGYVLERDAKTKYIVACRHTKDELLDELYTIIDEGCGVIDVIVEHSVYGQITGLLHLFSRRDVDNFWESFCNNNAQPLCTLTDDVHLHTLACPTKAHYENVVKALSEKGYLYK